jgi:hypothetical protein
VKVETASALLAFLSTGIGPDLPTFTDQLIGRVAMAKSTHFPQKVLSPARHSRVEAYYVSYLTTK